MARRKTKRTVTIQGQRCQLELRLCANPGCDAEFWALEKSAHSICSAKCYEYCHHKPFFRQPMPPIRRFGDKGSNHTPKKEQGGKRAANGFEAANYSYWHQVKILACAKKKRDTTASEVL